MTLLTARNVADMLGVSAETILRWTRRRDLPAIRLPGGVIRYREDTLDAWLSSRELRNDRRVGGPPARSPSTCRGGERRNARSRPALDGRSPASCPAAPERYGPLLSGEAPPSARSGARSARGPAVSLIHRSDQATSDIVALSCHACRTRYAGAELQALLGFDALVCLDPDCRAGGMIAHRLGSISDG